MSKLRLMIVGGLFLSASLSSAVGLEAGQATVRHGILHAACGTCQGNKACHVCGGSGQTTSGAACIICSGSKKCYVCGGTGEF